MVVVIDLAGQPHFFIRATISLIFDLDRAVNLAIDRIILRKTNIAIGFFELFLW